MPMEDDKSDSQPSGGAEPSVEILVNDVPLGEIELGNNEEKDKEEKEESATKLDKSYDSNSSFGYPQTPQLTPQLTQKKTRLSVHSTPNTPRTPQISNQRYTAPLEQKTWGHKLSQNPIFLWLLCGIVPLAYLALVFGVIPIGERDDEFDDDLSSKGIPTIIHTNKRFYHYWVFTCVVNPMNMTVIAFLLSGIFLSCMGVMRPFRVHWSILACTFVTQLLIFNLIVPFKGTFTLLGGVTLLVSYVSTLTAIYVYETWKVKREWTDIREQKTELSILHKNFWQFVKVAVTFLVFFCILILYMWGYQYVGSGIGQKLLPFAMTIGVFIMRKIFLALTDCFPLDVAMLISGFWVENIYDMFQTMAYRNVKLPVNYVSIWFTNCLSLLANLVFLTETWFIFRIWIKAYLPLLFTGKCCPYKLGIEPDDSEDDNERGHSNNKIGYHRRQVRFLLYKLFSKIIAGLFYLLIGTILRYGLNKELFPFDGDEEDEYTNSLQFSVYNIIFLVVAGILGILWVRTRYRGLYNHFVNNRHTLESRFMLGSIVALLIHNGIVAISMMMYFNRIYYIIDEDDDD